MHESIQTDLAVLGGGPGGYAAAFLAADRGIQTTLIDAAPKPGGTCLHIGCIPSKALLHAAHVIHQAHDAADFGLKFAPPEIDLGKLRAKRDRIIDMNASHLLELCKRRGVTHIAARGVFTDANTIQVEKGPAVRFKNAIIATGSLPVRLPAFFDLKSPRIMDSTAALALDDIPKTLLVVGGGYIGLEMGTVYAALGTAVTVVEMMDSLLPGVDTDLVQPLAARLKGRFKAIYLRTKVAKVEDAKSGIRATFEGEAPQKDAVFDKVLVSVGRRPNSANIGLDKAGVAVDAKGFIKVNEQRRSTAANIFAIGDVAGEPMLAHKASHEGKLAVEVIAGEPVVWEPRAIPAVVFTDPEIAWCGLTTTEAEKEEREVKVGKFRWAASGRAATLGRSDGLTKIITDPKTDRILGVGLVGPGAGELIAEGVVAIEMGATAHDLALCIHPHPTLGETISEAAETLHGLSSHIYVQRKKAV
jgi:dihydrolipoamide dehydrogenase